MTTPNGCDMHTHTHLSDGDLDQSPDTLCLQAVEAGIRHLSITDHDHRLSEEQRKALVKKYQIDLISGCEFSCVWKRKTTGEPVNIHLGSHWLDDKNTAIQQILDHNQNLDYKGRTMEMLYRYRKAHPHHALNDLEKAYEEIQVANPYSKHLGKRAVAKFLVAKGCAASRQEAYKSLAYNGEAYVPPTEFLQYASFEETMEAITKSSICTLNHLYYYHLDSAGQQDLLQDFKKFGGQALETVYSPYDQMQQATLFQICREYELLPNCGSDRHDISREFIHGPETLFYQLRDRQLKQYGSLYE